MFRQVNLTQRVLTGLIGLNSLGFRDLAASDVKFIKLLLVAIIGTQNVKNDNFDPLGLKFIKGN